MNNLPLMLPTKEDIISATELLAQKSICSEVVYYDERLQVKMDCLLTGGSYKIRGVEYFTQHVTHQEPIRVLSAGNLAIATAICCQEANLSCIAVVPDTISSIKRERLLNLNVKLQPESFDVIWNYVVQTELCSSMTFLHPLNKYLLAGYASIIVELKEMNFTGNLVIPYGLGGLATALASAIELFKLDIKLYLCEITGFSPFHQARSAKQPVNSTMLKSFIEAMGLPTVIEEVFLYLNPRMAGIIEVSELEVKQTIASVFREKGYRLEGAAGACLAAGKKLAKENTIALLTGANLTQSVLDELLLFK